MELKWKKINKKDLIKGPNLKTLELDKEVKLINFIKTAGVLKNLIVYKKDASFVIVDGNKLFDAAVKCGITEFICVVIDKEFKDYFSLMLNVMNFKNDLIELTYLINNLNSIQLESTPFDKDMIETFKELLSFDWNQYHKTEADINQQKLF